MSSLIVPSGGGLNPSPTIEEHLTNRNFITTSDSFWTPNTLVDVSGSSLSVSGSTVTVPQVALEWNADESVLLGDYGIVIRIAKWGTGTNLRVSATDRALTGKLQINDTVVPFTVAKISSVTYANGIYIVLASSAIASIGTSNNTYYARWGRLNKIKLTTDSPLVVTTSNGTPDVSYGANIQVKYDSKFD